MKERVPEIRFQKFDNDGKVHKLSQFADKAVDNRGKTPPLDINGNHPLIEVASLGGLNPDYSKIEKYLNDEVFKNDLRAYIKEKDILFTTVGSVGLVSLMDSKEEAAIAQNIVAFRAKNNFVPEYLYALLSNKGNQNKAKRIVMGAVQPSIKASQLVEIEYIVTDNIEEQQKIGSFFAEIDTLITLNQQKLDKLKTFKKSCLEKMFPKDGETVPEVRFQGFEGPWEWKRLGDISIKVTEKNIKYEYSETFTNSAEYGIISQREFFDHDISNEQNMGGYYVVREEDFVYNPRISTTAPCGPINCNFLARSGIISPLYTVFRTCNVNRQYLSYYFKTSYWHAYMKYNGDTGARSDRFSIKDDLFFQMQIPFPKEKEQQKIGVFLLEIDKAIMLDQQKLDKLKNLKKALLDKMFV